MTTTEPDMSAEPGIRRLISIVVSFRNEELTLPPLIRRLDAAFASLPEDYEIVFVNDDSTDASLDVLLRERERNKRVTILNMTRQFGVFECLLAGLRSAIGDAVIFLDADLQDPPEVIPEMLEQWRRGADVVHTVRLRREGEPVFKLFLTGLAYRVIRRLARIDILVDAGDFKLLSRRATEQLLLLPESDPYLRGLAVWVGFPQAVVPYVRAARALGSSHFSPLDYYPWKTLISGLTSFSFAPIYAIAVAGGAGLLVSLAAVVGIVAYWLSVGWPDGLVVLAVACLLMWSTAMLALGTIGLYLSRIYKDTRGRPRFIVREAIGRDIRVVPGSTPGTDVR